MLPVEEILRLDREAEEKRKNAAIKRKKHSTRMKFGFFSAVAFLIILISPQGLRAFADFAQSRALENPFFMKILQTSSDVLWTYGYLEESYNYYKFIYDNVSETNNLKWIQDSFYNMALTQYHIGQMKTSMFLYKIYKKRWPESDQERLDQIEKRIGIIATINANVVGSPPPQWVYDLADKYGVVY